MPSGPRRRLNVENVNGVSVISFVDTKIVSEALSQNGPSPDGFGGQFPSKRMQSWA
jgi:hypothetical protein